MNDANDSSIESALARVLDAAARADVRGMESCYSKAVAQATMAYGADRASFALLCMCQAMFFQKSGQILKAESFNSHLREMLRERGVQLAPGENVYPLGD